MEVNNLNLVIAWETIQKAFPILTQTPDLHSKPLIKDENDAFNYIKTLEIAPQIQSLIISRIENHLQVEVVPQFWHFFAENTQGGFSNLQRAVDYLMDYYEKYDAIMARFMQVRALSGCTTTIYHHSCLHEALIFMIKGALLSQMPHNFQNVISEFYEKTLKMQDPEEMSYGDECIICKEEICDCSRIFQCTNQKLAKLGLLEPLVGQTLTNLIYNYIQGHIERVCKDNFDTSHLEPLEKWLHSVVISWLKQIYDCHSRINNCIKEFDGKLMNFMWNTYAKIRIDQLFNIIIEYPDSLPALEDLRISLPKTDLKKYLIKSLQESMETRLLHPGVSTSDVLTAYVSTIRSLRVLDAPGLLLKLITPPIHQYLRSRDDTIRCVVSSLTEEGPNDLAEEFIRGEAIPVDENVPMEEALDNWETWTPDPIDSVSKKSYDLPRTSDIITMLVNVYGSKELFVNEYRTLLADRLLSQYSCDTEKEIRNLELLKLRFGDSQLHFCEVMLKDIADSKRINQHIKQDLSYTEGDIPLSALIVSAQFWPAFKDEKLELHKKLIEQRERYTTGFETLKGSRTLCWKNHLGIVDLEIELSDRTLNLSVSPVHATILMHFQDNNVWSLTALSKVMQVPPTSLRNKINFWKSHGVISELEPDLFHLQEEKESINLHSDVLDEYESESAMASAQDQREEELQTFWSYILGMLMNLDTLPLDRIHQMLKMFAFQGSSIEFSLHELKSFLDRKVREHKLIYSNGLYKLPK